MKYSTTLKIFSTLVLTILLFGCMPKSEVEEATLTLDKTSLQLNKSGEETTLTISTNQNTWSAFSPADGQWLTLEQSGNTLKVKASENTIGTERKTTIVINAHGKEQTVELTQEASDISIISEPAELSFGAKGGTKSISVATNGSTWTIQPESEVEWISLENNPGFGMVFVTLKPNETSEARTINLIAKSGDTLKSIKVTQEGKVQFILPLPPKGSSNEAIIRFESSRGSVAKPFTTEKEATDLPGYTFITTCDNMPTIYYHTVWGRKKYISVRITASKTAMLSDEYKAFMEKNGFKFAEDANGIRRFINEEKDIMQIADVTWNTKPNKEEDKDKCVVVFSRYYKQEKPQPTLPSLKMEVVQKFLMDTQKKRDDVIAYEKAQGSELVWEDTGLDWVTITRQIWKLKDANTSHILGRYWFYGDDDYEQDKRKDKPYQMYQILDKIELVFFNADPDYDVPTWKLTNEFKELLKKEGFIEDGETTTGLTMFRYKDTSLFCVPMVNDLDHNKRPGLFPEEGTKQNAELGFVYILE